MMTRVSLVVAALMLVACGTSTATVGASGDAIDSIDSSLRTGGAEVDPALPTTGAGKIAVLVGFRSAFDPEGVKAVGGAVHAEWRELNAVAARLPAAAVNALAKNPNVAYIEEDRPVFAYRLTGGASGITLAAGTGYRTNGSAGEYTYGLRAVQGPAVWDADDDGALDTGAPVGSGVKVCVIDTGIDPRHAELKIPYQGGYDFVDNDADPTDQTGTTWGEGHGTHVSGTIAAQLGTGGVSLPGMDPWGVAGVAPGAAIYMVRVLGTNGSGTTTNVINGINWCKNNGMHIASLSLGSSRASHTERTAFDAAYNAGLLIFAANGNDGNKSRIGYPAGYAGVIAVGAVDANDQLASFSQTGTEAELSAPGVSVASSVLLGSGLGATVSVGDVAFASHGISFSAFGSVTGTVVNCGLGDSTGSCVNKPAGGFVAYVDRGTVTFADKVTNVIAQGASAVIIANNDTVAPDDAGSFTLGAAGTWPPTASVSFNSGAAIKSTIGSTGTVTVIAADYDVWDGTSMATPHAAAVGALVWSKKPFLTNAQLRDLLDKTAKDLGASGWDSSFGYGLVQAKAAIDAP